jgi:hypothetical protein
MKHIQRSRNGATRGGAAAWISAALLAGALAVPACTTSTPATAKGCSLNSDCAAGLSCALGRCRAPCITAADCPVAGSSCIDDGRSAVCQSPAEKNTACTKEADCPVPLACASDYRCRNLCLSDADCNVLGIVGRTCAQDVNGVYYCADPSEVTNGVLTTSAAPGAPNTPVVEPEAGGSVAVASLHPGDLIDTSIGPNGGTVGAHGITVTIPAGALSTEVDVTIQLSGEPGPNGTVGQVFEIGPTGTTFALPVTIAFDYTDSGLGGSPPGEFAVETSIADSGPDWTALAPAIVDVYAHTVAGQTMHFSPYALVKQQGGEAGTENMTADSGADGTTCTSACTAGAVQCAGGAIQTCQAQPGQANACTQWATTTTCGPHQGCTATGQDAGAPSCSCTASPCTEVGPVCQDAQTVAVCAKDADGCLYVASSTSCTAPMSCSGAAAAAQCALTCTDSCKQGQTTCVAGGIETCTLGANGCWAYGPAAACGPHQSCAGAAGAAACECNADPVCKAAGTSCANTTTLVTCATDAQGCAYEAASSTCTSCSAGACCTSSCVQGQTICVGGSLASCTLQSDGCWAYGTATPCATHQTCTGAAGAAACNCSVDPVCMTSGMTCADTMTLATCSVDAQKCIYESATSPCVNGACSGGACCVSTCTAGQVLCSPTGAADGQPCTLGSNGCWTWGPLIREPTQC